MGARFVTEVVIAEWHGDGATLRSLLDGTTWREPADSLVMATTNVADTTLHDALAGRGLELHTIGDCVAPRLAAFAFHEGRRLARKL